MRELIGAILDSGASRRCSMWSAILFAITMLLPGPTLAQYAEEWHEWHGQQWNGRPGWLPSPAEPPLDFQYGRDYPAPGYHHPDHSYAYYPYASQPYPNEYSSGFSDGFAAGYEHGFTGGLNNAFAGVYDNGYTGRYDFGYYNYPYPYHGY